MMYLRCIRVSKNLDGKGLSRTIFLPGDIKWSNDFNEFNIFDPEEWRKYLHKFVMPNGNRLPSTYSGDKLVYYVKVVGTSKEMVDYFDKQPKSGGMVNLFPGYHEDGRMKDAKEFGSIR